jgi:hypothetical protein
MMRKAIVLSIVVCWILVPGLAMSQSKSNPKAWTGNVNGFVGAKILDQDDWAPVDEQGEIGALIDFKQKSWPISIAIDLLSSYDEEDVSLAVLNFGTFDANLEGNTTEFNFGVRKIWDNFSFVRPFIGGGIAFINAEVKGTALGVSVSDDDTGVGVWFDGGVYFNLTEHFNLGWDVRWSKAEVTLFNIDGEAGGWHLGMLIGYHW